MACKMTAEDHQAMTRWAYSLGESFALGVQTKGGSLGSAREGMIAALTQGFDDKAAELLVDD